MYRFHHLHLICSNLDQMENFFTEVLGAELVERKKFGDVEGAIVDLTGTRVYLRMPREGEEIGGDLSGKHYGYDHLGLVVDDLDAAYEELRGKGFVFTLPPTGKTGRVAFFKGPDNISVELFQPPG